MTAVTKCYHTHADGECKGWWATATHPAHLDSGGKLIANTAWSREIHKAKTLDDAVRQLDKAIEGLPA